MSRAKLQTRNEELTALNSRLRQELQLAELQVEQAKLATSRVLAVASHDLRQPLQTLVLLQGLLAKLVEGDKAEKLFVRLDEALTTLSSVLSSGLDTGNVGAGGLTPFVLTTPPAAQPVCDPNAVAIPSVVGEPIIFVVDDAQPVRDTLRAVLEDSGRVVEAFASCEEFLAAYLPGREACLLVDAYLPGMSGLALLQRLHDDGDRLPAIMITGNSDVAMAVQAMKSGALDFMEKPVGRAALLDGVERALAQSRDCNQVFARHEEAASHLADLTPRQRQIMDMVLAGHPSKNIAADLGISQRTVENHRATIMKRTGSKSLPALARLAVVAAKCGPGEPAHQTPLPNSAVS